MNDKYILDDNNEPVLVSDLMAWAEWFETADRTVKKSNVGGADVSTVFLGIDHSFNGGPPMIFETMIFGGPNDQFQERYSTFDEAEKGHARIVARLNAGEVLV